MESPKDLSSLNLLNFTDRQKTIMQAWSTEIVQHMINIRFSDSKEDQERTREFVHYQGKLMLINEMLAYDGQVIEKFNEQRLKAMQAKQSQPPVEPEAFDSDSPLMN